jgi:putative IMPACT (imprinted ancient) family translation regulator
MINAYKSGAAWAIEEGEIVEKTLTVPISLQCAYQHLNEVMRIIKREGLIIQSQKMELDVRIIIDVPISEKDSVLSIFNPLHNITIHE